MKKNIIILMLFMAATGVYAQSWVPVIRSAPNYSFSLPATPSLMDSLNIRFAYYKLDSTVIFNVMEFKDTPLDSSNAGFEGELLSNHGDTLRAIASTVASANNSTLSNVTDITTFANYKGLEVKMQYNDPYQSKTVIVYTRYFYNSHTLLFFTVTGTQDALQQLQSNKTAFFTSIAL